MFKQNKITLMQDNKSTITLAYRRPGRCGRTKHINIKYFSITENIKNETIKLEYIPSHELVPDGLTKPLRKKEFEAWRIRILNM